MSLNVAEVVALDTEFQDPEMMHAVISYPSHCTVTILLNVAEVIALDTEYYDREEIHACDRHFQCTVTVSLNVAEVTALDTDPRL